MKYLIGIQPTGRIHIGNYLGCLKKGLKLQAEGHDVKFLIANYHSKTTNSYSEQTEIELKKLGCLQIIKQTPEYAVLFFELCCLLNLGTLLKMPQYKDKRYEGPYDMGLLLYPVLMAADIIINDPDVVIIGKDQIPHIELTNVLVKRYLNTEKKYVFEFGDVDKVMSLTDPFKKMSKSGADNSVLYLFDEDYEKKLRRAISTKEGIENLLNIASALGIDKVFDNVLDLKLAIAEKLKTLFKNDSGTN